MVLDTNYNCEQAICRIVGLCNVLRNGMVILLILILIAIVQCIQDRPHEYNDQGADLR